MTLPEKSALQALYDEALARVRNVHVKRFPDCEELLFLISDAYPGVWLEHAYDAVCYARFEEAGKQVLRGQLHLFLDKQKPDGQLPCFVLDRSNPATKAYGRLVGYGQLQECVSFTALCLEAADMLGDEAFLAEAYEKCAKWDAWLTRNRMTTQNELIELFCTFDTGHDNSARLEGIPGGCPGGDAKRMNELPFLPLLAPDMNAVFYGSRAALAGMAHRLGRADEANAWQEKAEAVKRALMRVCYDPETDYFYDVDRSGAFRRFRSIAIANLFQEHVLEGDTAEHIYRKYLRNPDEFWTPFPFPSMSSGDPAFRQRIPGNDWGFYAQALTALRALRWMDYYGKGEDLDELLRRWVTALANAQTTRFGQELHPLTGEPSRCSQWYSSALLLFLHGVKRLRLLEG